MEKKATNPSNSKALLKDLTWLTQQPRRNRSKEPIQSGSNSVNESSVNKSTETEKPNICESPGSPYYPPPPTFIPPESPNMDTHHSLDSSATRPQAPSYNGVTLAPGQLTNLTTYGLCSITDANASSSDRLPCFRDLPHKLPSDMLASSRQFGNGRPAPIWGTNPPAQQSSHTHQQPVTGPISFPELASKEGARVWNPSVFDDRWLLKPEEMFYAGPGRQSVMTKPSTRGPEVQAPPMKKLPSTTLLHRRAHTHCTRSGQNSVPDYTNDPLAAYAALVGTGPAKKAAPNMVRTNSVPGPKFYYNAASLPEVRRLMEIYRDHGDARYFLPREVSQPRDFVQKYLYSRVFDSKDSQALTSEEVFAKVLYGGNIITRCDLHSYLLSVLDHMAEDMTVIRRHGRIGVANESGICSSSASKLAVPDAKPKGSHGGLDWNVGEGQLKPDLSEQVSNDVVLPGEHSSSRSVQASSQAFLQQLEATERPPTTYYQNTQAAQQISRPVYISHGQAGNPMYGRRQPVHAVNSSLAAPLGTPLGAPFQVMRPAATQRLAPSILRAGSQEPKNESKMFPDRTPKNLFAGLAQPPVQRRLSVSSTSTEVFKPKTFSSSNEPKQIPVEAAYSASSSSKKSQHLSRDYVFPDPNQQFQSVQFPNSTHAAQFNQISRHSTPARPMTSVPITQSLEWERRFGAMTVIEPVVRPLTYHPGFDVTKSNNMGGSSVKFQDLTRHGKPTYEIAINQTIAPFEETAKETKPPQWGVLKISNIPYSLTRAEVVQFLGRNAKIVTPDFGSSVHIIMDRSTGKTNECYVEFFSIGDAQAAMNRLHSRGRHIKIGTPPVERVVTVELSSQDALLKDVFPRAKNVTWKDGIPIIEKSTEPYNSGFKAFVTGEEMVMLVRHAEQPHRSNYTQKCPQRTFETMISTLSKFPWHAVQHYTIATRNQIFAATRDQVKILVACLKRGGGLNINQALLTELMFVGLNTPGFSENQRWELVLASEYVGGAVKLSPLMKWWPWEALGRKAGSEEDVVEYYASLLKSHPFARKDSHQPDVNNDPFGNLPLAMNIATDTTVTTMEQMGYAEWNQFKTLLRDVLI